MAKIATTTASIAEAFAALTIEGQAVTVRSLRARAGVGTDAARQWLATNRPQRDITPAPTEVLAPVLQPLWAAAVAAARDEQAEAHAAEHTALIEAEATALSAADAQKARADEAEGATTALRLEVDSLTDRLAAAETALQRALADAQADALAAKQAITIATEKAHTAEVAAAEAHAVARTLREVLDQQQANAEKHTE